MTCKKCKKEAKFFWKDKEHLNGRSETFYRDLCIKCYIETYNKKPLSLQELNEQRKKLKN